MRVLAMLHAYPPTHNAGGELTAKVLLEALAQRGHQVEVLLSDEGPEDDYELGGVAVHAYRNSADPFRWFGTDTQPHVVISHLRATTRAGVLTEMHQVPHVQLVHNTHLHGKHCLRRGRTDLAVYNSHWVAQDCAEWFADLGLTPPPSLVVHPPVVAADYAATPGKMITLINLCEEKGGRLLWELAARLPNRQFLGVTGGYGEQVLGEEPNVTVLEHQPPERMAAVYQATKVLLMPSSYESYGRAAVEAACSGIPTIAHPTPGLAESLGDAVVFCDREDPEAWVAALRRLWTPKGYAVASRKARELAKSLTPQADLEKFADAVEGVAHARPAAAG